MEQKKSIPAYHILNLALKDFWEKREYGPSVCGAICYPVMWVISYCMKRYYLSQHSKCDHNPDTDGKPGASSVPPLGEIPRSNIL